MSATRTRQWALFFAIATALAICTSLMWGWIEGAVTFAILLSMPLALRLPVFPAHWRP